MGQSGSGKSTILRLILGILQPDAGQIFFKQFEITRLNPRKLQQIRRHIGMVHQYSALLSSLTVCENVALPLEELTEKSDAEIKEIVFRIGTHMAMLYQGKIIAQGKPEEIKKSRDPVVAQFLSGSTEGPILEGTPDAVTA